MTNATIVAGRLTASRQDRVVAGLLLPYGEVGRTNLGKFTVSRGTFELPADPSVVTLNLQHADDVPIGRALTLTDTEAGVVATFSVARTPQGDAYLDEVERGTRNSLSAEVTGVIVRQGKAKGGRLYAAAACDEGAFPSAKLLAADVGDLDDDELHDEQDHTTTTDDQSVDEAAAAADQEDPNMGASTAAVEETDAEQDQARQTLLASLPTSLKGKPKGKDAEGESLFARLAAAHGNVNAGRLLAALDQVIQADADPALQKQWLGEIYASRTYQRRYAPLIAHGDLTGLHAVGWKFTEGKTPTVGDYAGYPAQPTSTEVKTEPVTLDASRIAGAGGVDRAFVDFKVDGFWQGYYRECTNDYERKLDAKVPALLAGGATAVVADAVPAGVATAASFIVDGAAAVLDAERGMPTFAIVGTGLWKGLLKTRSDDTLAYLTAALGLDEGSLEGFKIVPSSLAAYTNKVLVGVKDASTLYELPGSPIRVDTVNIANGGVETGVFGYWSGLVNDAKSLALVAAA